MCGRYATSRSAADLVDEFDIDDVEGDLAPDYNVAPTKDVWVVLERPPRGEPDLPPRRQLRVVRWGLVPSWAKDVSIGSRLINARMETVAEKPAFKKAFASRRCLVPADGYYEWYDPPSDAARGAGARGSGGSGRTGKGRAKGRRKQPFFIRPRGGGVLAMAGLYELWRDESRDRDDPAAWLWTTTVLTTTAEDELGRLHDRMPLLLEPARFDAWLDPSRSDPNELLPLLVPAAPGRLEAYPVSMDVGNVANEGAYLVEPIQLPEGEADAGGEFTDRPAQALTDEPVPTEEPTPAGEPARTDEPAPADAPARLF